MRSVFWTILLALPLFAATGCGEEDTVLRYETTQPASYPWPTPEAREGSHEEDDVNWVWEIPANWVEAPEVSEFHIADYRFPGSSEMLPGRLTLSVSMGDGGGVQSNISRWRGQLYLVAPKGPAPGDQVSQPIGITIGTATIVEFAGQYQGEHVPTHLLGAVVQIPAQGGGVYQTWFFKMLGDRPTIEANRVAFLRMLLSLRPEGTPAPELPEDLLGGPAPEPRPTPLKPIEDVEPDNETEPGTP